MARINLARRWVDHDARHHAYLLRDLLLEYLQHVPSLPPTRSFTIGVLEDASIPPSQVVLQVMPVDSWSRFVSWCSRFDVRVAVTNKHIDGSKTWWPTVVEVIASSENPRLFQVKLSYP